MNATSLTIASVLYGGVDTLRRTMPTWAASANRVDIQFLFVDNSPDESAAAVVSAADWGDSEVVLISDRTNPGFAASANRALHESDSPVVFLLNADVFLTPEAVDEVLVRAAALSSGGSAMAVSLVTRGVSTCGVTMNLLGYMSDRPSTSSRRTLGPSGGAALLPRALVDALGGFEAAMFAWGEDADLALRMFTEGVLVDDLMLDLAHVGGHSIQSLSTLRLKAYSLARNRIWTIRARYSWGMRVVVGTAQLLLITANGVRKLSTRTSMAHFHGMFAGLTALPLTVSSRRLHLAKFIRYHFAKDSIT